MNATLLSDMSLYELAIQSARPPIVSQLSPATFKSAVGAMIDRLVENRVGAIVWAKLPKGDSWQAEVDRYSALSGLSKTIYNFKSLKEDQGDDVSVGIADSGSLPTPVFTNSMLSLRHSALNGGSPVVPIALESSSLLRREYFLIVWSAQFQGIILAHRPRTVKATQGTPADGAPEDNAEKKQTLLTFVSFDSTLVADLIQGVGQALATPDGVATEDGVDPVAQWQGLLADLPALPSDINVVSSLFTRQMQKQDDLWQRYTAIRKQAETAAVLQRQNEELVSSVRLKDDFLSNVGQELRTPLTTIKTALTLLNSPNLKPPQRQRYMELIAKECDRQSSLITSLLDLVQLDQTAEQTSIEPIKLCETVPGFVSTYQPLAEEKGIMMAYTIPEDLPAVSCAKSWLRQIVINLLHNGIKFTPSGGQVWVKAKQQGDYVQLELRDTGIGIAPSEIPKIFDRFYRVRQVTEENVGAGLGLTIVQQLLLYCGGSISVKSRPGEGSTFNVLLPIHRTSLES
jgi:two-component system, OmpR family, phosphate regulon sensor histidine kinase PhoR